jgi:hypothetical protein
MTPSNQHPPRVRTGISTLPLAVRPGNPADNAERRREALRRFLRRFQVTPTELARRVGAPTGNSYYNFLNGRTRELSLDMIERILLAFPSATFEELVGLPNRSSSDARSAPRPSRS